MKLVFVYNADDGVFSAVTDTIHKVLSPSTYQCQLCQITYGLTTMHKDWRRFLEGIDAEKEFLHRNEFIDKYPESTAELPAIFKETPNGLEDFLTAAEIRQYANLQSLIKAVEDRLPKAD